MAAVTITTAHRHRAGPTALPGRRAPRAATRAVYRRRRFAAGLAGIALVLVMARAGAALGGPSLAAPERRPAPVARTVVRPGDSLWSVAVRLAPGEDPRPVVDALAQARGGTVLVPGERIEWGG